MTLSKIYNNFTEWTQHRTERQAATRDNNLRLEAEETAQICEFGGKLYITINGRPIIACEGLKGTPLEALKAVRGNIYNYTKSKAENGKKRFL